MNIFIAAINSILANFTTAIKASLVPFLIGLVISTAIGFALGLGDFINFDPAIQSAEFLEDGFLGIFLFIVLMAVVWVVVMSWIAMSWHRAILLGHSVSIVPSFNGLPFKAYVGRLILLGIVMILIGMAVMLVFGAIAAAVGGIGTIGFLIMWAIGLVVMVYLSAVWLRMASTLPGLAIEKDVVFGDGWAMTESIKRRILGAALALIALSILVSLIQIPLAYIPILSGLFGLAWSWFQTMLGVSILTEIYSIANYDDEAEPEA